MFSHLAPRKSLQAINQGESLSFASSLLPYRNPDFKVCQTKFPFFFFFLGGSDDTFFLVTSLWSCGITVRLYLHVTMFGITVVLSLKVQS